MTDKEQIKCKYKFQDKEKFDGKTYCTCFCELCEDLPLCDDNCQIYEDFKQLTFKTQECEELKKELMRKDEVNTFFNTPTEGWANNPCDICESKNNYDRYCKTLEEIENYTRKQFCDNCEDIDSTEYSCHCEYCEYQEYFDIINKVKGEGNEICTCARNTIS